MICACGRPKSIVAGAYWCPQCDDDAPLAVANSRPEEQRWHTYQECEFIQRLIATANTTALRGLLRAYAMRWTWQAPGLDVDRAACERMIREALGGVA